MSLKIHIDAASLAKEFKELASEVEADLKKGMKILSTNTHRKIVELANQKLKSTRENFLDSLGPVEEIADGVWVITLGKGGMFIEDGLEAGSMKPGLLKNGKTSKDGYRYKVIPFKHATPPSRVTSKSKDIINTLRKELNKYNKDAKKKDPRHSNIPWKEIEYNADGTPKLGKLHSLDLPSSIPGKGNTPSLHRVSIYQSKRGDGSVKRDITTFRTVTSDPATDDKWIHPGLEARKIMNDAADWAEKELFDKIVPEILKGYR